MNRTLFHQTYKSNWRLFSIFFLVCCLYLAIIISLIDAENMEKIRTLYGSMGGMLSAFGINVDQMTNPLAYTSSTFFGLLDKAFVMVFYIMLSYRLIAKQVENGSLTYTLAMPISRKKLIRTQALFLVMSIVGIYSGIYITGFIFLSQFSDFDMFAFSNLLGVTLIFSVMMSLISFFLSVAFCTSKLGFILSTSVPIAFLLLSMLVGAVGESFSFLEKISPFSWIDSVGIVSGTVNTGWMYCFFLAVSVLLYRGSIAVFERKNLPL